MKLTFPLNIPSQPGEELSSFLRTILAELRRFADRNIDIRQNCKVTNLTVTTTTADTEVTVAHNLGVTPFMYIANVDKGGIVYDSRKSEWGSTNIFIKCSIANASIAITVLG